MMSFRDCILCLSESETTRDEESKSHEHSFEMRRQTRPTRLDLEKRLTSKLYDYQSVGVVDVGEKEKGNESTDETFGSEAILLLRALDEGRS